MLQNFKYEEAAKEYEKILSSIPPSLLKNKIYFQLGEIYNLYLNDHKKSIYYFERIIKDTSDIRWKIQAKEKLADIYFNHLRDFPKAERYYKKLCHFFPKLEKRDFYQQNLGISYLEQGHLKKAEVIFNQILIEKNHRFKIKAYYYLGLVKFNSKKWHEAIVYWQNYLKRETNKNEFAKTKFLLANAYESMEELQKAHEIYYSILGEYPNSQVVRNRLESIYKRKTERRR